MKVVIIGGTGLIGRKLSILASQNHDVVSAARPRVEQASGAGVAEALTGAHARRRQVLSFEERDVLEFFRTSTGNLLGAAKAAGVAHYRAAVRRRRRSHPRQRHLRAKRVQEQLIEAGGVPYTILRDLFFGNSSMRSQQWVRRAMPFICPPRNSSPLQRRRRGGDLRRSRRGLENAAVELAGPEASSPAEFIQSFLSSKGGARKVIPTPTPRITAPCSARTASLRSGHSTPRSTRFADWSRAS